MEIVENIDWICGINKSFGIGNIEYYSWKCCGLFLVGDWCMDLFGVVVEVKSCSFVIIVVIILSLNIGVWWKLLVSRYFYKGFFIVFIFSGYFIECNIEKVVFGGMII